MFFLRYLIILQFTTSSNEEQWSIKQKKFAKTNATKHYDFKFSYLYRFVTFTRANMHKPMLRKNCIDRD